MQLMQIIGTFSRVNHLALLFLLSSNPQSKFRNLVPKNQVSPIDPLIVKALCCHPKRM